VIDDPCAKCEGTGRERRTRLLSLASLQRLGPLLLVAHRRLELRW
jgi:hypothetical protein